MSHNLTNFLPSDRIRHIRLEYFFRLLTVLLIGAVIIVLIHGLLLFPTYQYVTEERDALATHLAELSRISATADQEAIRGRLKNLRTNAERLSAFAATPSASGIIGDILDTPRAGITISGVTLDVTSATERRVRLSGKAVTRESLRQYHQALSTLPSVTKADLPLSAYAKDSDIPFTILLSGTLTP